MITIELCQEVEHTFPSYRMRYAVLKILIGIIENGSWDLIDACEHTENNGPITSNFANFVSKHGNRLLKEREKEEEEKRKESTKEKKREEVERELRKDNPKTKNTKEEKIKRIYNEYNKLIDNYNKTKGAKLPKPRKLTTDRKRKIRARLREGYTVEDILEAGKGILLSDFHTGTSFNNSTPYVDITVLCKSDSQIEKMQNLYREANKYNNSVKAPNTSIESIGKTTQADILTEDEELVEIDSVAFGDMFSMLGGK